MRKKIVPIILILCGLFSAFLGTKVVSGAPANQEIIANAVYVTDGKAHPENEGKVVIVTGTLSAPLPFVDEETGVIIDTIVARRYVEEAKVELGGKDEEDTWTWLCEKLRQVMSDKWSGLRGIEVFSVALESVTVADLATVTMLQRDAVFQNPIMAAAHLNGATADAMEAAAANASGAAVMVAAVLDDPSSQNRRWRCPCGAENNGKFCTECGAKKPAYI